MVWYFWLDQTPSYHSFFSKGTVSLSSCLLTLRHSHLKRWDSFPGYQYFQFQEFGFEFSTCLDWDPKVSPKNHLFSSHPFSDESIQKNTISSTPTGYSDYMQTIKTVRHGTSCTERTKKAGWESDLSSVHHKGSYNNLLLKGPDCVGQ